MAKKIKTVIKLQVPAGKANPGSALGSMLGPHLAVMDFCKLFNARTQKQEANAPIPTIVTIYQDRSFEMETKTPPISYLIKKAAKQDKGSTSPGITNDIATLSNTQVEEIAKAKMADLNAHTIEAAMSMVVGSARSMGIGVDLGEEV